MFLDWISWERKFWILGAVLSNRDASSVFLPHSFCLLSGNFRLFSTNVVDPDNFILQTYITQPFLKPKQVSNVGISCVFSCVQSMWFHKSQRWLGGHFMTAGPVEEGVTQEKQTVITVSSLTFSYIYLLYFSLHLIARLLETAHGEKSQTIITALYPTILSTSITTWSICNLCNSLVEYKHTLPVDTAFSYCLTTLQWFCCNLEGQQVGRNHMKLWIAVKPWIGAPLPFQADLNVGTQCVFSCVCNRCDFASSGHSTSSSSSSSKKK